MTAASEASPSTAADRAAPLPPGALVWTGRHTPALADRWPGGRDGWNTPRKEFLAALGRAGVVVLIDPVSVPWPMMGTRPDVPLLVLLPPDLDAETLSPLLGQVLFSLVTPFDRLLHPDAAVRRALSEEWQLPDGVWLPWDGPADGWEAVLRRLLQSEDTLDELATAKARWVQPRLLAADVISHALRTGPSDAGVMTEPTTTKENGANGQAVQRDPERRRRVALAGRTAGWEPLLMHSVQAEIHDLDEIVAPDGFPLPAPDGIVLVLDDGGQPSAERRRLLRQAHDVLRPGAALVVVAHVVDTDDDRANPSLGALLEEVHEVTGTSVHLDSMVSARWVGDRLTRGVVLRFTSLRLREI